MRSILVAAVATTFLLTACGADPTQTAADPAGSTTSADPAPATAPATPEPTVGSYPGFAPSDYTFTVRVSCFCAGAGVPIDVQVADGKVVEASYARTARGVRRGDPAEGASGLTIDRIIAAANDTGAAQVDVSWPAGQDYPSSVYVDQSTTMADEEVGYTITHVVL